MAAPAPARRAPATVPARRPAARAGETRRSADTRAASARRASDARAESRGTSSTRRSAERRHAPARLHDAGATKRPALRVVDARRAMVIEARQRRARLIAFGGGLVLFVSLFATAASHALLVSGQARLDHLQSEVSTAQADYSRARLRVAKLEAPERIVRAARTRLGMVTPERVTYLSASGAVAAEVGAGDVNEPASTPATAGGNWSDVKPFLASQGAP